MASTPKNHTKTSNDEEEEDEDCMFAMQLASASVVTMSLKAAIELDLLEIMARAGPGAHLSTAQIASQLPTENPDAPTILDRMLRLLSSYSILTCSLVTREDGRVERLYGLAPVCKFLTRNGDGVSFAPFLVMNHDKVFMETWYNLKDAVVDGGVPFDKAYGMNAFEYTATDPRFNNVFNKGMLNHTTIVMKKILETYKGFEGLKEVVDVGGGVGATLNMIISKYPQIKGINYDLPHVVTEAPMINGVEHVGGDMFDSVPGGEAIFMKVSTFQSPPEALETKSWENPCPKVLSSFLSPPKRFHLHIASPSLISLAWIQHSTPSQLLLSSAFPHPLLPSMHRAPPIFPLLRPFRLLHSPSLDLPSPSLHCAAHRPPFSMASALRPAQPQETMDGLP